MSIGRNPAESPLPLSTGGQDGRPKEQACKASTEKGALDWQPFRHLLPTRGYQPAGVHNGWEGSTLEYYGTPLVRQTIIVGTMVSQSLHGPLQVDEAAARTGAQLLYEEFLGVLFASSAVLAHTLCARIQHNMPTPLALLTLTPYIHPTRCLPWAYHSCTDMCSTTCAAPLPSDTLRNLCCGSWV